MNEMIEKLAVDANAWFPTGYPNVECGDEFWENLVIFEKKDLEKFAELIVKEYIESNTPKPKKPECSICGTTKNVRYVGGHQPYLCGSKDCIPF